MCRVSSTNAANRVGGRLDAGALEHPSDDDRVDGPGEVDAGGGELRADGFTTGGFEGAHARALGSQEGAVDVEEDEHVGG